MYNYFSKILKGQKILFIIFLSIIVCGLSYIPYTARADGIDDIANGWTAAGPMSTPPEKNASDCNNGLGYIDSVTVAIPDVILFGSRGIANWTTWLSSMVISKVIDWPITNASTNDGGAKAFVTGWGKTRDLANMLIVLGFVIVGIATALRIREYEAKKFLWPLIIVALLINFSGLLCGLIIDGSNITMKSLTVGTSTMGSTFFNDISASEGTIRCVYLTAGQVGSVVIVDILFGCIYLALAFSFLYLALILIARYAILGILFILSPLAFIFWAFPFPKAKDLWNQWWAAFLKWAFVGVSICFFLWLANGILQGFQGSMTHTGDNMTDLGNLIFYLAIILMVIVVGIKISSKGSGIGSFAAGAVMGLATGGAGLAMGAIAGGAKLSGLTGLAQRGGQKLQDTTTKVGEKFGLVSKGTTEANRASRLDEPTKRLDKITNNQDLAKIAEQRPITAQQSADKAAAAQILAKRPGGLNSIDPTKRDAVAAHAQAFGVSKDTFTKGSPEIGAGTTDKEVKEKIMNDKVSTLMKEHPGMSTKVARDQLQYATITPADIAKGHIEMRQKKITENALGIAPMTDRDVTNKLVEDKQKSYLATGMSQSAVARAMKDYKPNDLEMATARESFGQERIQKSVRKLSPQKAAELPGEAMTPDVVQHFETNQMAGIYRNGNQNTVNKFKEAGLAHIDRLNASGDTDAANKFTDKMDRGSRQASGIREEDNTPPQENFGGGGGI